MSVHHPPITSTDRLHLGLAAAGALLGTTWGALMALLVVLVVLARVRARQHLASTPVRRGVLPAAEGPGLLDLPGQGGEAVARP